MGKVREAPALAFETPDETEMKRGGGDGGLPAQRFGCAARRQTWWTFGMTFVYRKAESGKGRKKDGAKTSCGENSIFAQNRFQSPTHIPSGPIECVYMLCPRITLWTFPWNEGRRERLACCFPSRSSLGF